MAARPDPHLRLSGIAGEATEFHRSVLGGRLHVLTPERHRRRPVPRRRRPARLPAQAQGLEPVASDSHDPMPPAPTVRWLGGTGTVGLTAAAGRRPGGDGDRSFGAAAPRYRLTSMRIDPAGWPFISGPLAPAALLAAAGRAPGRRGLRLAAWPFVLLSAYMALFFRDPDRRCDVEPPAPDDVLSPADGVVMVAGEPQEGVAPEGDWQQVSVFLSVVDVHVNRSPYHGEVVESSYRRGSFLAAYRTESAHRNERSELWLRDGDRTVVFRQIVGVLARRIVTRTGVGRRLATGERMGLMKFGSRMDVFVPRDCTVLVQVGQRVRGGETVIARWSDAR